MRLPFHLTTLPVLASTVLHGAGVASAVIITTTVSLNSSVIEVPNSASRSNAQ